VGGSDIVGIVVHIVLLWQGAILGEMWCTWCYCGREQYCGNCGAHGVIEGWSNMGGIAVHMVLLWEGAILGEMWCTWC
jgi:hypothetical protein